MVLKNTDTGIFINTSPSETAVYAQIGEGFENATPSLNPTMDTKHYINHKGPTNTKASVARQWALSGERYKGDAANDYIMGLADATGADAETDIVICDTSATPTASAYPAKKYEVTVAVNNDGSIVGGETQAVDVTIYANGDAVVGTFNISTKAFTPTVED